MLRKTRERKMIVEGMNEKWGSSIWLVGQVGESDHHGVHRVRRTVYHRIRRRKDVGVLFASHVTAYGNA